MAAEDGTDPASTPAPADAQHAALSFKPIATAKTFATSPQPLKSSSMSASPPSRNSLEKKIMEVVLMATAPLLERIAAVEAHNASLEAQLHAVLPHVSQFLLNHQSG